MKSNTHVVMIAGEESGDIYGADIIRNLQKTHPSIQVSGIGGHHMAKAGMHMISNLAEFGVTGFLEVFKYLPVIRKAYKSITEYMKEHKPDLLVLIDYPGFNLRLAKYAKSLHIPIIYYISPQIWAWKAKRIEKIRAYVDMMAVILPFERDLYIKEKVPVRFVGHPMVDKVQDYIAHLPQKKKDKNVYPIIAMLPGSRRNEIKAHMPVLAEAALLLKKEYPNLRILIPVARSVKTEYIAPYFQSSDIQPIFMDSALEAMHMSDCVIVASGTAALQCGLLEKPMCVIYKSSVLTYIIALKVMRVKYLSLCNLIMDKMIVPELLQYDCTSAHIVDTIHSLLDDTNRKKRMLKDLHTLHNTLSAAQSECSIEEVILEMLSQKNNTPGAL